MRQPSSEVKATVASVGLLVGLATSHARADRYEATLAVRPVATLARIDESGASAPATVPGGGVSAGLSWGLRNWLDVETELAAITTLEANYPDAMVPVSGNPQSGELQRTTHSTQLRAGATLRLGVGWVPTVHFGLGAGARIRSAATLRLSTGAELSPDDAAGEVAIDIVALIRVGLEHRLSRRWSVGVTAGAAQWFGLGAPDIQAFDGSLTLAYTWYPLW